MKKKKEAKLDIGTSLVFEHVRELKDKFDSSIKSGPQLRICSTMIKNIDLTGVQLIQYFILQADHLGKELLFSLKIDQESKRMLLKNGFSKLVGKAFE